MNVPELRFPEFSGEWEEKKIKELFEFLPTNSFSRANLNYENGEVKNIHYGDIHTKFPTNLDCEKLEIPFINPDIDLSKIKPESYCKNGDLVIADASEDYNDIGKAIELNNVNSQKLLAGLHTFLARDKSGLTVEGYRGYMLLNNDIKLQIKKIATGISVLGISKTNLGELNLKIPSIDEQEKIASFLSKVDEKIEKLEKKQELWETYKKGMMQKIFSQELRFKDENGEDYPDWEEKKLGDICDINKGSQLNKSEMINEGNYYVLNGGIDPSGYTNEWNVLENSITISEGGNSCGYVNYNTQKFWCGGHCYALINLNYEIHDKFLYQSLKNNEIYIMRLRVGSGLPNIQKKDILNFKLNIPKLQEQIKIGNFLLDIDIKLNQIELELKSIKKFKKGLLQKMFC